MTPATVRLGPFDAERWWRPSDLAALPAAAPAADTSAMDELLAGFCAPGDLLLTRRPIAPCLLSGLAACGITFQHTVIGDEPVPACDRIEPYAVVPQTKALDRADRLPEVAAVAAVNSKTWSNALAERLGLPGTGRVVRSTAELVAAVAAVDGPVVVKDPYGVSGRAALEVTTPGVLRAITRTLDRQRTRVELLVQRRFDRVLDFSAHLEVSRDGGWRLRGVREMVNRGFRYLGSGPPSPELAGVLERAGYRDVLAEVASALHAAGYWGPAGVDSMLLRDGTVVPLLEINARQSMGLLSLALGERLPGCRLRQLDLSVPLGTGIEEVLGVWAPFRFDGSHGIVVLGGSALTAPGGRVHYAVSGDVPDAELIAAAATVGVVPRGVPGAT